MLHNKTYNNWPRWSHIKNNNNIRKKTNKRPTGLIGHLSNCCGAFAMYIHVQYDYRANEIVFV